LRNKAPISARLVLDAQLRGNVGVLSEDLANDLFQQRDLQGKCQSLSGEKKKIALTRGTLSDR
jgi:peroxin-6